MILKEMVHRKVNSFFILLAVVTAVAFFVAFVTMGHGSKRETTRLMRDMGYNLRIVPRETDMERFWTTGYSDLVMEVDTVNRFASQRGIAYAHLLATLQRTYEWDGSKVLLTGIGVEVDPADKKKSSMIFELEPGHITVGWQIAKAKGIRKGDPVQLGPAEFVVDRTLSETGSVDDIRVYTSLDDAQRLLNLPGKINEIKALDCLCRDPNKESIDILRAELEKILPEAKVIKMEAIAQAREKQRIMVEDYFAIVMPIVVVVCAVWIGTLALLNTRDRRYEIGVMRALGYGSGRIAWLFLGKAVALGLLGAAFGFGIGSALALQFGPDVFKVTAKAITVEYPLLWMSLVLAPLFSALSSFIPAMIAVTDDPASILREQ